MWGAVPHSCQPEVEHLDHAVAADLDIRGLDVPMNDALLVCRLERFCHLTRDGQRLVQRKAGSSGRTRPACYALRERGPIHQLQHQSSNAGRFFEAVDGGDVRVRERGQQLRFAREPRQVVRIDCETFWQYLQRDITIQFRVARSVHLAHGAHAEEGDDVVGTDAKTRREGGARPSVLRRYPSVCEELGEYRRMCGGQVIEEAGVRGVRCQQ